MIELNLNKMINLIPQIDSNVNYWLIRSKSGEYYTDFNINNYIGIGYNKIKLDTIEHANNNTEILKNTIIEQYKEKYEDGSLTQPGKIPHTPLVWRPTSMSATK